MDSLVHPEDAASIAVFDMIVDRLSELEQKVSEVFQFLREPHMQKFQKLDIRLFSWALGDCKVSVRYDAPLQVCLHTPGKHGMMLLWAPFCILTRSASVDGVYLQKSKDGCYVWLQALEEHYVDWFVDRAVSVLFKSADLQQLPVGVCIEAWPLLPVATSGMYAVLENCNATQLRSAVDYHMYEMKSVDQRWLYLLQHPACQSKDQRKLIEKARKLVREEQRRLADPWDYYSNTKRLR